MGEEGYELAPGANPTLFTHGMNPWWASNTVMGPSGSGRDKWRGPAAIRW